MDMDGKPQVFETIRTHLLGRGIEAELIVPTARFDEDLNFDSLDLAELTLGLEEKLGVEIADEELEGVRTLQQAADVVARKVAPTT